MIHNIIIIWSVSAVCPLSTCSVRCQWKVRGEAGAGARRDWARQVATTTTQWAVTSDHWGHQPRLESHGAQGLGGGDPEDRVRRHRQDYLSGERVSRHEDSLICIINSPFNCQSLIFPPALILCWMIRVESLYWEVLFCCLFLLERIIPSMVIIFRAILQFNLLYKIENFDAKEFISCNQTECLSFIKEIILKWFDIYQFLYSSRNFKIETQICNLLKWLWQFLCQKI